MMWPGSSQAVRTVAPTAQPVTLSEAKAHLRVTHAADDSHINMLIAAATAYLDGLAGTMNRALITQTWRQNFWGFGGGIRLQPGPVASITTVKYYDTASTPVQQTLASSVYELKRDDISDYIKLKWGQTWPNFTEREDAIEVTWVAGVSAASLEANIKAACLLIIGSLYENREEVVVGAQPFKIPFGVEMLIAPLRKAPLVDCYLERIPSWV